MTDYKPPTENLPIFDAALFESLDIPLTQDAGDDRYLRFPNAQGTENFSDININGTGSFYNGIVLRNANGTLTTTINHDPTTTGVLDAQDIKLSAPKTYPNTTDNNYVATIKFVNDAVGSGSNLLASDNTWTGQNYFEGDGPSTITIKDGSEPTSFPISITSSTPPYYGIKISGGGVFIGNNSGSATSSNYIYLSCDDINNNQLNILGDVKIINNGNDLYNATLTATSSLGLKVDNQLTVQGSLNIRHSDGTYYTLTPDPGSETLVVSGNIKMVGVETYIAFPYTSNNDVKIYQNYDGNIVLDQGGLVVSRIPTMSVPVSNKVLIIADENINNQLDIEGTIAITTTQTYPQTTNTNQLSTIGYVNSAVSGSLSGIPTLSGNNTFTGTNAFNGTTTAATQNTGTNNTTVATTAFVNASISSSLTTGVFTDQNNTFLSSYTNTFQGPVNFYKDIDLSAPAGTPPKMTTSKMEMYVPITASAFPWSTGGEYHSGQGYIPYMLFGSPSYTTSISPFYVFDFGQSFFVINAGGTQMNYNQFNPNQYSAPAVETTNGYGGDILLQGQSLWLSRLKGEYAYAQIFQTQAAGTPNPNLFLGNNIQVSGTNGSFTITNSDIIVSDGTDTVTLGPTGLSTTNASGLQVLSPIKMNQHNIYDLSSLTVSDPSSTNTINSYFQNFVNNSGNTIEINNDAIQQWIKLSTPNGDFNNITANNQNLHSNGNNPSDNREIYLQTEDGNGHPQFKATLYETSTIIRDDYIKIGNKSYNTSLNTGDLYCNNVNLNTINGLSPTTIGLTWADFNPINAYNNLPSNVYSLSDNAGSISTLSVKEINISNPTTGHAYVFGVSGSDLRINPNGDRLLMGDTTESYWGDFSIGSHSTIGLNVGGNCKIDLNSRFGNLVAGDTDQAYNKTILYIDDSNRKIDLNAVDILSNTGGNTSYVLPINFTTKWRGNYYYTNNNNWEMVQHINMNLPVEYFTLTGGLTAWKYEFAMNCYNCNNQTDKAYAMYLEFVDNNNNSFQSFCFNFNTPFTTHKNHSTYSATSNSIENYCYTDHIDFNGSTGGPFDIRLWRYGDNNYSCDFNAILTLSKTNLV